MTADLKRAAPMALSRGVRPDLHVLVTFSVTGRGGCDIHAFEGSRGMEWEGKFKNAQSATTIIIGWDRTLSDLNAKRSGYPSRPTISSTLHT